jgi:shikimate dehydrogenase/3-dehydroquinate dehydratase type I
MTNPVPAMVVTLTAVTVPEARRQVAEAAAAGADLAEIRFDLWSPSAQTEVGQLFPSPLPLLATLRSRAEGGAGPNDAESRAGLLTELARHPFRWIDLEADRDLAVADRLPPADKTGRILSKHYPTGVSADEWGRRAREPSPAGAVRKVVARSSIRTLFDELLPRLPPPGETALVAMTTGPSGPLLRAWSRRYGYPMVYAALPQATTDIPPRPPVEPSQIPIDHLRPFLTSDAEPPLFGLAGHPVAHSRSPAIHARWMRHDQRAGLYVLLDFESETEFVDALAPLAEGGFRGLGVTHPYKAAALEAATEVAGGASACGVANCLTFRGEAIEADNTDLVAILHRMEELKRGGQWDGRSLSVVGAGGAARATLAAARAVNAEAHVYARRPDQGETIARTFDAESVPIHEARPDGLVVHATNAGRQGSGPLEIPIDRLVRRGTHVVDWVYAPDAPLVRDAVERAGATYEDGRRLLVYQAAAAYGIWWGEEPSAEEIRASLTEEGCAE